MTYTPSDRITYFDIEHLHNIPGRGNIITTRLGEDVNDFNHLINKKITINGKQYLCTGVEHSMHGAPYKKGERIGLLIRGDV